MKTIILSLIVMVAALSANGQSGKTLVVYYSLTGNTEVVAKHIQSFTGADLFKVETVEAYPDDYRATTEAAKKELNDNARPRIKGKVENIERYDTIFVGFPIWWGTYPMAVATFLDGYNLDGKTVIPFCTHGGGGVDKGFRDVESATPKSGHNTGLSLNCGRVSASKADVEKWLKELGII